MRVETNPLRPVYLLVSTEPLLIDRALTQIREAAVPETLRAWNEDVLNARQAGPSGILSSAKTLPMMGSHRLVIVRGLDALPAKNLAPLADYLGAPNPSTVLVCPCEKVDRRLKFFAQAQKLGFLDELKAPRNLVPWLQAEATREGVRMAGAAAERLIDVVGSDLSRLAMCMEQLATYAGNRPITVEDVDELIADTREHTVFELTDAIGSGHFAAAQAALSGLADRRESAIGIISLLARHLRQLGWILEGQRARMSKAELIQKVGAPPFIVDKLSSQARRFTPEKIESALVLLKNLDFALKGGVESQKVLGRDLGPRALLLRTVDQIFRLASAR
jgi:DNA polymerase-3 subunit delta